MISEFTMKNLMSIRSKQKLSFIASSNNEMEHEYVRVMKDGTRILKAAVIFGNNTTGKSSITKSIELFQSMMTVCPKTENSKIGVRPFLFDISCHNVPSELSMSFYIDGVKNEIFIKFDNDVIYEEYLNVYTTCRPTQLYYRKYRKGKSLPRVKFSEKIGLVLNDRDKIADRTYNNRTVIATFARCNVAACHLDKVYEYFKNGFQHRLTSVKAMAEYAKEVLSMSDSNATKAFILQMMEKGSFLFKDISISRNESGSELVFHYDMEGLNIEIHEMDEAKGALRFLGLMASLYNQIISPSLVMVDSIDKELTPELREFYYHAFLYNCKNTSQVLLTTHTFELLDFKNYIRRDIAWITEKEKAKGTELIRICKKFPKRQSLLKARREGKLTPPPILGNPRAELGCIGM